MVKARQGVGAWEITRWAGARKGPPRGVGEEESPNRRGEARGLGERGERGVVFVARWGGALRGGRRRRGERGGRRREGGGQGRGYDEGSRGGWEVEGLGGMGDDR